jgi:hypothetical protein
MNLSDIKELYFIAPITTVPSILKYGILSHCLAEKIQHDSIAMEEIQQRRTNKKVPGGYNLHEYVNLYFDAHNPMLSKVREYNDSICILCVKPEVLKLENVIISDRNASSGWAIFHKSPSGLEHLSKEKIFATFWKHDNQQEEWEHKSVKCSEVLIPNKIDTKYIFKAIIYNEKAKTELVANKFPLTIEINNQIFF